MYLQQLQQYRQAIQQACEQYGASNIRVFGSVARGTQTPNSDIDLLVNFPKGYDMFAQRLPLQEKLAAITGHKLDLIPEHELNPYIKAQVLKEAIKL